MCTQVGDGAGGVEDKAGMCDGHLSIISRVFQADISETQKVSDDNFLGSSRKLIQKINVLHTANVFSKSVACLLTFLWFLTYVLHFYIAKHVRLKKGIGTLYNCTLKLWAMDQKLQLC